MEIEATGTGPSATPEAKWQKSRPLALTPATTTDQALAEIVLGGVEHLRGNEACVAAAAHEEGVHQMRVAIRRLRSCLALFADFIPEPQADYLKGELRWLIGELGPARDWDVFIADILRPVTDQFADEVQLQELASQIQEHREEAYERAQHAIADRRYVGLLMLLDAWAEGRRWREDLPPAQLAVLDRPCLELVPPLLEERYQQARATGEGFADLSAKERHKVRIQVKKLRYATEFFASLYPRRGVSPYLALLKDLQDELGTGNDISIARDLLRQVTRRLSGRAKSRLSYASGLIVGWHSHQADHRDARMGKTWERFVARTGFWVAAETALPKDGAAAAEVIEPASPQRPTGPESAPNGAARKARAEPQADDGPTLH